MRINLKNARKEKGMTQKEVAEYLKVSARCYQSIELGKRDGKFEYWDKLEDLFGIHQRILRQDSRDKI